MSPFFLYRSSRAIGLVLLACLSACTDTTPARETGNRAPAVRIHFVSQGSGEPVVLVHGFSQTHEAWQATPLFDDLTRNHRVIAVDLRGHGDSDKPHKPKDYGVNMGLDLVRLLDQLSIDRAHFVGFSLGASVVGGLLVSNPDRVQTATMGSGFFTVWDEREEAFAKLTEGREASREVNSWEPENQDFRALAAVIRGAKYSSISPDQITSVTTPTLIVFGSIEVEHMTDMQKQQLGNVPDSIKTLIVEGADHDSAKAAVLSAEFSQATRDLIAAYPTNSQRSK